MISKLLCKLPSYWSLFQGFFLMTRTIAFLRNTFPLHLSSVLPLYSLTLHKSWLGEMSVGTWLITGTISRKVQESFVYKTTVTCCSTVDSPAVTNTTLTPCLSPPEGHSFFVTVDFSSWFNHQHSDSAQDPMWISQSVWMLSTINGSSNYFTYYSKMVLSPTISWLISPTNILILPTAPTTTS